MHGFMVYFDSSSRYECITYHLNIIRSILTRSWISGGCVKQQCDVGPSISLLATQIWHFEMNRLLSKDYEINGYFTRNQRHFLLVLMPDVDNYVIPKVLLK